ncbi:hypothetical protein [Kitasatospora kifunensis]|uniref:Uncharacterized protein n=1 Tax=Kitasatospora kifunensis TaxID=58351 RepID=A0A7W7QYL5_KITKI|nr:hypothetical protein [Kitasatospora kifunensis]MBB4922221.1 hypothetical protein [Kitasatospora kifunensis]
MNAILAPVPILPRASIVAVTLPTDGDPLRSVWLDENILMVGFDPARLTRHLVELVLTEQLGAWIDGDSEAAR